MEKEYKHWKYINKTPASGLVYHHINRRIIMVVYAHSVRLFKDIPEFKDPNEMMYPCHALICIERRQKNF